MSKLSKAPSKGQKSLFSFFTKKGPDISTDPPRMDNADCEVSRFF
jgi:hypothetical protein